MLTFKHVVRLVACVFGAVLVVASTAMAHERPDKRGDDILRVLLQPTEADRLADWQQVQAELAGCMDKSGFAYRELPHPSLDVPIQDIVSPATRRHFGYGIRRSFEASAAPTLDPNADYELSLDPEAQAGYRLALVECSAEATRSMGLPRQMLEKISADALSRRLSHMADRFWAGDKVVKLVDRYVACMNRQGFKVTQYSDPAELLPYDLDRLAEDTAYRAQIFAAEAQVALIDATCMNTVYRPLSLRWIEHARESLDDLLP